MKEKKINNKALEVIKSENDVIKKRKTRMNGTSEEDKKLLMGIQYYGETNWTSVASYVGNNRTRSQCSQRYKRDIGSNIKREKWTSEEEDLLLKLIQKYGFQSWAKISREFGNRSDVQCRFRFNKYLKFKIRKYHHEPNLDFIFCNLSQEIEKICSSPDLWDDLNQDYQKKFN